MTLSQPVTSQPPVTHPPPPITSFHLPEDEEDLTMKMPIYQPDATCACSFGLQCYRINTFWGNSWVFWVLAGDALLSGAGVFRGFVFLRAAGAGRRLSTQRHADRKTESRPHKKQGE